MSREANAWDGAHGDLLSALEQAVGPASGDGSRSAEVYRRVVRELVAAEVTPATLALVFHNLGVEVARANPMSLASFVRGKTPKEGRYIVVSRWVSTCGLCDAEIPRGALCWFRKPSGGRGWVACGACEEVPFVSERADAARKRALEKDGDRDSLLAAILAHTPAAEREAVEDGLPMSMFVSE